VDGDLEAAALRFARALPDHLGQLVRCESPSTDNAALARSAELVARIGEEYLGVAPELLEIDGRPHLRWRFGTLDESRLLILGHHDTVWPIGTLKTFPWTEDGVRALGPGSFDMKAGLLQAFAALSLCDDKTGVTVLGTADEELGAPTSRSLIESEAVAAGTTLVFEASADSGAVKTARKGVSRYSIHVFGKAAHAGLEPWNGVNATVEAARLVLAVARLTGGRDGTTVTPTLLSSGTSANTVPAEATLIVDVRATSADEQQRVFDALKALEPGPGARIEVEQGPTHQPLEHRHSTELYELLVEVAVACGIPVPEQATVGGASDGNIAAGVGSRVLDGLGAVGAGAHAPGEYVMLDAMVKRALLTSRFIQRILADHAG